jgi:hypothetical protein
MTMANLPTSPDDRPFLPGHSMSWEMTMDAPSDEEAQDAVVTSPSRQHQHKRVLILGTRRTSSSRRRRSQSLHSIFPEPLLTARTRNLSVGYDSEPSDLSSEASADGPDANVPEQRDQVIESMRRRRWPLRVILLLFAYVAWTTDSYYLSDRFLRGAPSSKATAAFSSQHGREVALPVAFPPLSQKQTVYVPPLAKKKHRPTLAYARPGNPPPVLGERPMERFILQEEGDEEQPQPLEPKGPTAVQWVASVALLLLILETVIRQVHRQCTPRQRLRYE